MFEHFLYSVIVQRIKICMFLFSLKLCVCVSTDLKVEVLLEKTILGKWTKQGSIKEIHLISGDSHDVLTK